LRRPQTTGSLSIVPPRFVDEFDDQLGQPVGERGLAGEQKSPRHHLEVRILPQPVVQNNNSQGIQQLSLVFVDPFDLTVENRVRVDRQSGCRFEPVGKMRLRRAFGAVVGGGEGRSDALSGDVEPKSCLVSG
jgi:hypothetical protein